MEVEEEKKKRINLRYDTHYNTSQLRLPVIIFTSQMKGYPKAASLPPESHKPSSLDPDPVSLVGDHHSVVR